MQTYGFQIAGPDKTAISGFVRTCSADQFDEPQEKFLWQQSKRLFSKKPFALLSARDRTQRGCFWPKFGPKTSVRVLGAKTALRGQEISTLENPANPQRSSRPFPAKFHQKFGRR